MNHELDRVRILNRLPIVIRRLPISMLVLLAALPLAAQDWSAGFHGNDHSGYGWLTHYYRLPTGPGEQLVFSGTVSYLYYDAVIGGSRVRVTSPGVGAAAMYRWSRPNLSLGVGPGWEVRWTDRGADRVTESGALLLGDMSYRPADATTVNVGARYSGANDWFAANGNVIFDITPQLRAGPDGSWQGNQDVTIREIGGIAGIPYGRTWMFVRAGQSRITYRDGSHDEQPYFSVGIGRSF
jgi:hypothetical protein